MNIELDNIKKNIINSARHLYSKNLLAAADGNISYRLDNNNILITPSGYAKNNIDITNIATIDINNNIISGNPSSEKLMHCFVYKSCSSAKVVIHAHPPTAIAWTVAEPELKFLPSECLSEVILATGGIPIAPFSLPGTNDMGEVLSDFLPDYKAIILARHGAIAWGESFQEALNGIERIEHTAEILYKARAIKQLTYLSDSDVKKLYEKRALIGNKLL